MQTRRSLLRGAVDGVVAMLPFTAVLAAERALVGGSWSCLPPMRAFRRLGLARSGSTTRTATGVLAYFAVGAALGSAYAALGRVRPEPRSSLAYGARGIAFAGAVWTFGYVVLLPALGLIEPWRRTPATQLLAMWVAHVAFGGTLAALDAQRNKPRTFSRFASWDPARR